MNLTNQAIQHNIFRKMLKQLSTRRIFLAACLLIILTNVNVGQALAPLTGITKIAAGNGHTCALTNNGTVKCWGLNFFGQLGDNTNIYRSLPVDVIAGPSLPPLTGVTAISTGLNHTCVLINGGAKCWGDNAKGQLGDGTKTQRLTPVNVSGLGSGVVSIAAAASHTCALLNGGGVKCWGDNVPSRLGDNTVTQSSTPVDVLTGPGPTFPLLSGATLLAAGSQSGHTCAIVGSGVSCWGSDVYGQLGVDMPLLGVSRVALPVVGLGGAVSALALGSAHSCAIVGASVQCWGNNDIGGQLGDNTLTNSRTPVNVVSLTSPVAAITAGTIHTCALTTAGGTKCWGNNNFGQLGDSSMMQRLTPVDVSGLTSGLSAIAAGGDHTCALTNTGGVKCWGFNGYGQLGDNTDARRLAPVDVLTDSTAPTTFTITPSAGANGAISPNTPQVISAGSSQVFTATPNAGFSASVGGTCGGTLVGLSYTTSAITANCTVVATFAPATFTITPSAGANGAISPNTPQVVSFGSSRVFTVAPGLGFAATVSGTCGGTLVGMSYTTNAVTANCTVVATFVPTTFTITPSAGADGTISPSTPQLISAGSSQLFTVTPNAGFAASVGGTCGGTLAGTSYTTNAVTTNCTVVATFNKILRVTVDLNADGKSDLIFRNGSTGQLGAWLMNGLSTTSSAGFPTPLNANITHVADFNGEGKADLLLRADDGTVSLWLMDGLNVLSSAALIGPASGWRVTHVADFDGDGKADLLWRNTNGTVAMWLMNGTKLTSSASLLWANLDWTVSHIADFDGDGKADILWRNTNGTVATWLMNGTSLTNSASLLGANSDWSVSHVADFDGDGKADILWRNTNGTMATWLMNGTTLTNSASLFGANPDWTVSHVADFNGNGKVDLLWRNTNGAVAIWQMDGVSVVSSAGIFGADANWRVTHIGDYNGDGKADLLWRRVGDGSVAIWLMNGAAVTDSAGILGASPWSVVPPMP